MMTLTVPVLMAEEGNMHAACMLGMCNQLGIGLVSSPSVAVEWFQAAAGLQYTPAVRDNFFVEPRPDAEPRRSALAREILSYIGPLPSIEECVVLFVVRGGGAKMS